VLEAALVAWIVGLLGDKTLKGARTLVFGKPEIQALEAAMSLACRSLIEDVPLAARDSLNAALAECCSAPADPALDGRISVKTALLYGLDTRIASLADPSITPLGRSYFEEIGVDGLRLREELPATIVRSIQHVSANYPSIRPLAAQLSTDSIQERVDQILNYIQAQALLPHPPPTGPPHQAASKPNRPVPGLPNWPELLQTVIDAVLDVPTMADLGSRTATINTLSPRIRDAIPRSPIARIEILNTIRTCQNYAGGLSELVAAIRLIERDSNAMDRLDQCILALDKSGILNK